MSNHHKFITHPAHVIFLTPVRISGLELALSFALNFLKPDQVAPQLFIVFGGANKIFHSMKSDGAIQNALKLFSCVYLFPRKNLYHLLRFIFVVISGAREKTGIVIHHQTRPQGLSRVILKLCSTLGWTIIQIPNSNAKAMEMLEGKKYEIGSSHIHVQITRAGQKKSESFQINNPKYSEPWITIASSQSIKKSESKIKLPRISIFVSSVVAGVFDMEDLIKWTRSISTAISHCDADIVVKFHPMQRQKEKKYVLQAIRHNNLNVSDANSLSIASQSDLAISASSSVILDCYETNCPVILFQEFTPQWLKRHPEKSNYLSVCTAYASDLDQLKLAIDLTIKI